MICSSSTRLILIRQVHCATEQLLLREIVALGLLEAVHAQGALRHVWSILLLHISKNIN